MYYVIMDIDGCIIGIIPQNQHVLHSLKSALNQHFDQTEGEEISDLKTEPRDYGLSCTVKVDDEEREISLTSATLFDVRIG